MSIRKLLLALGGAASLMLAVPSTAALASTQSHPDLAAAASSSAVPAPYPGAVSVSDPGASAVLPAPPSDAVTGIPAVAAAACQPYVDGDHAHVTSGDASAHGWWYRNNCPNVKTTVYVGLQEYYSDGSWRTKATGSAYVYAGGGSANWANARSTCQNGELTGWRSYIIVRIGLGASANTVGVNLDCRVY